MFHFRDWRFKSFLILFLPITFLGLTYFFLQLYVVQVSKQSAQEFYLQNSFLLSRGDSYELIYRINSASQLAWWPCIKVLKHEVVLYEKKSEAGCENGFFQKKEKIKSSNNTDLLVELTVSLPWNFRLGLLTFLLLQISLLGGLFFLFIQREKQKLQINFEWQKKIKRILAQISHDIRSPLAALKMVSNLYPSMDQEQKELLVSVSGRIESILSNIACIEASEEKSAPNFCFILPVLESIIAEKEMRLNTEYPGVEIELQTDKNSEFMGAVANAHELARVLSNVINNAAEAFELADNTTSKRGLIEISLKNDQDNIYISIKDNGKGIAAPNLRKILKEGGTIGKQNGKGLGLEHALEAVKSWGGSIKFNSWPGLGTEVCIKLVKVKSPSWLCQEISLVGYDTLIILEDDASVINAWKVKLKNYALNLKIIFLEDPVNFQDVDLIKERTLFIVDHDFIRSKVKGLDFIGNHQLASNAILCTSYFNDEVIQKTVVELGASMLPKHLLSTVKIQTSVAKNILKANDFKVVLIDDDRLVHTAWKLGANRQRVELLSYFSVDEFLKDDCSKELPIFIDKNLKNSCGLKESQDFVLKYGFRYVYLATGEKIKHETLPAHLTGITVDKAFPFEIIAQLKES